MATQPHKEPYTFMCTCDPFKEPDEDSGEDSDEDAGDADESPATKDGPRKKPHGEHCHCGETAASVPSHPFTLTRAGIARHHMVADMMNLRNPDAFGMHTFND